MAHAEWAFVTKNHEKGLKSAKYAVKIRKSQLNTNDWRMANSRHLWHSLSKKTGEMGQQLCADAEIIKQRFGQNHPRTQATYQRLPEMTCSN